MGDVVVLDRTTANSSSRWNSTLPDWPHPRRVALSIEQCRAIDRDRRHLDEMTARARDARTISTILSTICGAEIGPAERAARAIALWLRTGDDSWRIWTG